MAITDETIEYVAALAKLDLTDRRERACKEGSWQYYRLCGYNEAT